MVRCPECSGTNECCVSRSSEYAEIEAELAELKLKFKKAYELFGELGADKAVYADADDDCGNRACCGSLSYHDHDHDCPFVKLETLFKETVK